jgi:hypothetical protein
MTQPRVAHIMRATCKVTGVSMTELTGTIRHKDHVRARWAVMHLARKYGRSLCYIGTMLRRDHTTVLYGIRCAEKWIDDDPTARQTLRDICDLLPEMEAADRKAFEEPVLIGPPKPRVPFDMPEREPIEFVVLPKPRGRPPAAESNAWVGGWPEEPKRQPAANVESRRAMRGNAA